MAKPETFVVPRTGVDATPERYFDGEWQTLAPDTMRDIRVTDTELLEPMQVLNQAYQLHDGLVTGTYAGDAQNIYVLVTKDFLQPPTLIPEYGMYMDTVDSVYRNIMGANSTVLPR